MRNRSTVVDRWLLGVVITLSTLGLVMVFSSSLSLGQVLHHNPEYFAEHQLLWLVLGGGAALLALAFDYHRLRQWAPALALIVLVLLLLVMIPHVGVARNGARRWLGVGQFTIQPSELAKFAAIIYLARWLEKTGPRLRSLRQGLLPYLAMLGLLVGLVLLEKDLGTAMVMALIGISMLLVAGARWVHIGGVLGIVGGGVAGLIVLEPYRYHRIAAFSNPWADSLNTGFQSVQSVLALGSGGIWGVGLGQSVQKYQWLPAAHTDFIFAIIGEELGLIGTVGVLLLFCLLAWRGFRTALRAPDSFGLLVATGITSWLVFEAFINMSAVTVTLPTTGIPLPFVSFGGSSLAVSLAAIGVLLNISAQGVKPNLKRRAGLDFGRGHRGTHLPGAGRRVRAD
ncbi:MAG: putative lipid II flippase FtsW [Candidatus Dormibacteria bacterium]